VDGVEVQIAGRALWIDEREYPLSVISAVHPFHVAGERARIVRAYLRRAPLWGGAAFVVMVVLICAVRSAVAAVIGAVAGLGMFGVLVVLTVRLVWRLTTASRYVLRIDTRGLGSACLVSRDRQMIDEVAYRIGDAIEHPAHEYGARVAADVEFVDGMSAPRRPDPPPRAEILAADRPEAEFEERQMAALLALMDREGTDEVQEALVSVLRTFRDLAVAVSVTAGGR
jgi:Family of unknown function (DUF6232)